jgi:ABC-type transporter Mla subunit MlaD
MPLDMTFFNSLEPWIRFYSYFLIGFFLLGLLALGMGFLTTRRRLLSARRGLSELSPADPINGATEHTHRALVSLVESLPDRGGVWWVAVQPTVAQYARHDAVKGPQVGYFVTERAEESVLSAQGGGEGWLAFAHAVPGVLTSLGLLGTFVALLMGLYGLQKNADGTWAIDPLVSNLSGKFVTSIVALALSVVFVLLELMTRSAVTRARYQLAHALSRVLPFLSTSHLLLDMQQESVRRSAALNELHKVSETQASALMALHKVGAEQSSVLKALHTVGERQVAQLERFNTDLAVSIGSAMDVRIVPALERLLQSTNDLHKVQSGLGEELLKEVGDKISGAVSGAAGEEMRSMGEAIRESVRSLNEAAQAMRDGQSKLVEVTSAIIGQMNESFGDNSKRLSEATETAVRKVVEQIDGAAGGFSARIGGAGQEVAAALLTTSTNLQKVVDECQRIVRNTESTVQRFDGLVTSVSAATTDIVSAHEALRATAVPLQEVAGRTATLISSVERQVNAIGEAAESLKTTSGTMKDVHDTLKSSWSEYERRFVDVDQSLGNSLDQLRSGFDLYAEKLRELNAGLDTHLSKALSDLSSVINELHESVEDLQTAMPVRTVPRQA